MLHPVVFEEYSRGIRISAYTDLYAYDPENASLVFISLAGTDQAVKAVSSAIIGGRTVSIMSVTNMEIPVTGHPESHFRVLSTKLSCGAVHQLVVDMRFFGNEHSESRLIIIPQADDVSKVVYSLVLAHMASPLIPEWSTWICRQLSHQDLMRQMEGTLKVIEVSLSKSTVDEIISKGVRTRRIRLDTKGGMYAGIN